MNRPILIQDLIKKAIGAKFLNAINSMYQQVNYLPKISENLMGEPISSDHGVTQGRNSSASIFSFYTSDMNDPLEALNHTSFPDPDNMLQLADDTIILADSILSLCEKFDSLFSYAKKKYIVVNMSKTRFTCMHVCNFQKLLH